MIPKSLPKTQINCQPEIRGVNRFLIGEDGENQVDGTILSIDFKDAFRSISHRWFNLVLEKLAVPKPFVDWFWRMYKDLYVIIALNKYKSEKYMLTEASWKDIHQVWRLLWCH